MCVIKIHTLTLYINIKSMYKWFQMVAYPNYVYLCYMQNVPCCMKITKV